MTKEPPAWMPKNPYPKKTHVNYWETPEDMDMYVDNKEHTIFETAKQQTARKLVEEIEKNFMKHTLITEEPQDYPVLTLTHAYWKQLRQQVGAVARK